MYGKYEDDINTFNYTVIIIIIRHIMMFIVVSTEYTHITFP